MRRTDEAFKNEVLRRYGVQKRNRRNYYLLALSPLVLAIILGSLIFLPHLSRLFDLAPADDPKVTTTTTITDKDTDRSPDDPVLDFEDYLRKTAESITLNGVSLRSGEERLQKALQDLHYTESKPFDRPRQLAGTQSITIKFSAEETLDLFYFSKGKVAARHNPSLTEWYFTIPQDEFSALQKLSDEITRENTVSLASLIVSSDTITKVQFMNPDYSQTILATTDKEEIRDLIQLLETINVVPGESSLPKPSGITLTFHYQSGETVQMIAGDLAWCQEIYSISSQDVQSIASHVNELIRKHLPEKEAPPPDEYIPENYTEVWVYHGTTGHRRSYTYSAPLLEILREKLAGATLVYDPIQHLESYKIEIEAEGMRSGLVLDLDSNLITVSIEEDPNVYCFSLSAEDMDDILVGITNFIDEVNPNPITPPDPPKVNPIYPTLGNLCTEVHPTADYMRLYTEYLSAYDGVDDSVVIDQVMQLLHGLQLTETSTVPEYVFNQRIVNLWFTGYDYYVMLDDQDGWVRTFLYANDEVTLLEAKLYKGNPSEIAVITDYLENYNRNPWVDSLQLASLSTFRTFMKQSVASVELAPYAHFSLPFESTDPKVITAVINEILSMNLIDKKEGFSADYYDDSSYVNIQFTNGGWASLFFNTAGYVEYRLYDEGSGISYVGRYHLPAAEVFAFAEFIDPYLNTEPSGEVPLIGDLKDNAALQSFLAGVGVTVKGSPEDAPLDIQRILNNYDNTVKFFACELSYTSPDGIILEYLLYDYAGIDNSPLTDEERLGLVNAGVHPESLNFDVSRHTLAEIRGLLEDTLAYMPAFADNLHEELLKCTVYVPETDCYYQFHSDSLGYVVGINARLYRTDRADTVIVLFEDYYYGGLQVAAFRMVNGEYRLYGYTPI